MKQFLFYAIIIFGCCVKPLSAQTIRGMVSNADNRQPIAGVRVLLRPEQVVANLPDSTLTSDTGEFVFSKLSPGYYTLEVRGMGWETWVMRTVEAQNGKERVLQIFLKNGSSELAGVEITADRALRNGPGIQALPVESVLRLPAVFQDPARLTATMPGVVALNDGTNNMSVNGLAPFTMAWQIEGLEVSNPNHLANAGNIVDRPMPNGGGVNMLSTQVLANSAFFNGNLPASYGNAVGGLLDMRLRKGNPDHAEHTLQAGLIGLEAATEGPWSKHYGGSYLVNFRYSTVGLLQKMGVSFGDEAIDFQDLALNLYFPVGKKNELTVYGIGGRSVNDFTGKTKPEEREIYKDFFNIHYSQSNYVSGLSWRSELGAKTNLQANIGISGYQTDWESRQIDTVQGASNGFEEQKIAAKIAVQHRLNARLKMQVGISSVATEANDYLTILNAFELYQVTPTLQTLAAWADLDIRAGRKWSVYPGLRVSKFSDDIMAEPRLQWGYRASQKHRFSGFVGLIGHSPISQVFLGFSDSLLAHSKMVRTLAITGQYEVQLSDKTALTATLFGNFNRKAPVVIDEINYLSADYLFVAGGDYTGRGRSMGGALSCSQDWKNGFYWKNTLSLFKAEVGVPQPVGSSTIHWTKSPFDYGYVFSGLAGKEWLKQKRTKTRALGANLQVIAHGGENFAVAEDSDYRKKPYFRVDTRLYWKINKKRRTATLSLDIQNISNAQNAAWTEYDYYQQKNVDKFQLGTIPILTYRLEFGK